MKFEEVFSDKLIKPKEKTVLLSKWLDANTNQSKELLKFASNSKDPIKATCTEAFEFVTQQKPQIVDKKAFDFFCDSLKEKAPRIKWESAKVIGNTAALHTNNLEIAIRNLLDNAEHSGTVVRWSAAFALAEILKLNTKHNKILLGAIKSICDKEEKNSIKKIYLSALKKIST